MFGEDRRLRLSEKPNRAILLAWLGVCVVLLAVGFERIIEFDHHGPDDALRLVQVRDLLAGQPWFDLHQYRITPPEGVLMHWSRLVDVPIAGMIWLLSRLVAQPLAEQITMAVLPLLVLLPAMFAMGRLTWRLLDRQTAIFTCLVMLLMPGVAVQFLPMRIDHHGWQICMIALAVWATSWRRAARGGAVAGLAMAVGLMISLETIFMSAGFGLVFALRWLRDHRQRWWLVSYLQSLALGLVILFGATRGMADIVAHCDAISPPHLGFFLIVALGVGGVGVVRSVPRVPLILTLGAIGLAGAAFVYWSAPQCVTASPFASLDPLVRDYWYLNVTEGRPVWEQSLNSAIPALVQPLVALALVLLIAARNHDWLRTWWFEYAVLLAVAFAGGLLTFRSIAFAGLLSALPLAWFLARFFERWRSYKSLLPKLMLVIPLYLVFAPGFPLVICELAMPQKESGGPVAGLAKSSCELRRNAKLLDRLPRSTLFAPLDIGPVLLLKTRHSVVASGHHRAEQAMHDVIYSFISPPDVARRYMDQYGADYVVACTDLIEAQNLELGGGENALMSRLIAGQAPEWLEPVAIGGPEQFKVWRIKRAAPPVVESAAGSAEE